MKTTHDTYDHALSDYTKRQIKYAFEDVFSELDVIHARMKHDPHAELLLEWVRYAVKTVSDNYTE